MLGFASGPITAMVCGNNALRGSQDCVLREAQSTTNALARASVNLPVSIPPVPCPCVVRASTPGEQTVVTAPLVIEGALGGPLTMPTQPAAAQDAVSIAAHVTAAEGRGDRLLAGFGGSAKQVLHLAIRNSSGERLQNLRVVGSLNRGSNDQALPVTRVPVLEPNVLTKVEVPFSIAAPAFGTYTVHGTLYAAGTAAAFETTTNNSLWMYWLVIPLTLLVIARGMRRREKRLAKAELPQSSLDVGDPDDLRWAQPAYRAHQAEAPPQLVGAGSTWAGNL
jgi:hypothetical protein